MFILLILLSVLSVFAKCPLSAIPSTDCKSCYLASSFNADWFASESICRLLGGHLASVHSTEQNRFIFDVIDQNPSIFIGSQVWLGGNNVNGKWKNSDRTPFNYTNMPNGVTPPAESGNSICINTTNGFWDVAPNTDVKFFVCELPPCGADGSAPKSLLNPNDKDTGLIYGSQTDA